MYKPESVQISFDIDAKNNLRPLVDNQGRPTSLMMLEIYDVMETLPEILDPKTARKIWRETWRGYVKETQQLEQLGYRSRGAVTYIHPVSPEAAQEIVDIMGW